MKKKSLFIGLSLTILAATTLAFQNCGARTFGSSTVMSVDTPVVPMCREVDSAEVAPKLKWDWASQIAVSPDNRYPSFNQVMASPMVADLDGDKKPEVVFISFSKTPADFFSDSIGRGVNPAPHHNRNGVLRIVDGSTGLTRKSVGEQALAPHGSHSPLLVDIDRDGKVEIVYFHYHDTVNRKIIVLNYDGSLRWKYTMPSEFMQYSGFVASDVNNDGVAEFQVGNLLLTENAAKQPYVLVTMAGAWAGGTNSISVALDPSLPLDISLINYSGVYNKNGTARFNFTSAAYYFSVADIFPEKYGLEIIVTGSSKMTIFNGLTGEQLSHLDLNTVNSLKCSSGLVGGGPSSVGDFDGDPATIEIAVATGKYLTIFNKASQPILQVESQDCSSLVTGLTSFDLNGDKKPEILYADEEYFRIYEVVNGQLVVRHQIVNPSGTLLEYPLVVDVDGNGSAEIIVASNNYNVANFYLGANELGDKALALATTGVRAFESSAKDAWMPTRPIWNQFSFHPDQFNNNSQLIVGAQIDSTIFRRNNQGYNSTLECK